MLNYSSLAARASLLVRRPRSNNQMNITLNNTSELTKIVVTSGDICHSRFLFTTESDGCRDGRTLGTTKIRKGTVINANIE